MQGDNNTMRHLTSGDHSESDDLPAVSLENSFAIRHPTLRDFHGLAFESLVVSWYC